MSAVSNHEAVRRRLSEPDCYPDDGPVEVRETHISVVFLTAGFAWKLLKPVKFDFLDFSTVEARHEECRNELRWNRRLAPDVYLDAVPVTASASQLSLGGEGRVVDWLIKMRRLPDDATLESHIRNGTAGEQQLQTVLDVLVPFFESAERGPEINDGGDVAVIRRNLVENYPAIDGDAAGDSEFAPLVEQLRSLQLQFLATHEDLFKRRVRDGWIRDGHGDLRAEHVYLTKPPAIVDCIAFNNRFRHSDLLDEVCFLATDLERLGRADLSDRLIALYRERMHDDAPKSLAGFFKSYRYAVRAKVACLTAAGLDQTEQQDLLARAGELLQRAVDVMTPFHQACLLVFCGVSGSGKSTIARMLCEAIGAKHLASDVIRKELYGIAEDDHTADASMYSKEANQRTYATLFERAAGELQRGVSAVLDATFLRRSDRDTARQIAADVKIPYFLVDVRVSEADAEQRIRHRQADGTDPSDAGVEVLRQQSRAYEPPDDVPDSERIVIDSARSPEENCRQIVRRLSVVYPSANN